MITIPMKVETNAIELPVEVGVAIEVVRYDPYEGQYEFTPSDNEIIVPVKDKDMLDDITIHAIPSNYGKVSFDGSILYIE